MHFAHGLLLVKYLGIIGRDCNLRIMGQYNKGVLQQVD
jgi:hypothetical protein